MPKQAALPPTLPPRLIGREAAAAYISVSPNTFDRMIEEGRMPRPRILVDRRHAWDVRELDVAVDLLPHRGEDELIAADEGWS
jgi:predicted DNA-binding transcriptional regulator AlpA